MIEEKEWYLSKTLWVNILVFIAGVATSISGNLALGIPLTVVSVMNLVLRAYTKNPIFI